MKTLPLFIVRAVLAGSFALALSGCGSNPKPADWQVDAKASMDRSIAAYMRGDSRVEAAELRGARSELSRTGRADLLATAELLRCASRVASLVFEPCAGFEALRADATDAQRAYADYLRGEIEPHRIALLPPAQRAAAEGKAGALNGVGDPLSRLVAAGVLLQTGRASPETIALAVDSASAQGWRRPLLAWLGVQALRAEQAGDGAEAARLRRRIAIADGGNAPEKEKR